VDVVGRATALDGFEVDEVFAGPFALLVFSVFLLLAPERAEHGVARDVAQARVDHGAEGGRRRVGRGGRYRRLAQEGAGEGERPLDVDLAIGDAVRLEQVAADLGLLVQGGAGGDALEDGVPERAVEQVAVFEQLQTQAGLEVAEPTGARAGPTGRRSHGSILL